VLAAEYAATRPAGEFVVATDARRREVYWARYAPDGTRLDGPAVDRPDAVPRCPTIGPAVDLYPDQLDGVAGPRSLDPGIMAMRGPPLPDAGREPLYLRRPDATEPSRPKSVLHG
jgi:tRNA A37 threonylcarbamoyladenosine modification protein TsaB